MARHPAKAPNEARPSKTSRRVRMAHFTTPSAGCVFGGGYDACMANPPRRYPWWLIVFAILGFMAVCTALITLFSPLGRRFPSARIASAPEVTAPEFLSAVAGTTGAPVRAGGTVQLLNNGVA